MKQETLQLTGGGKKESRRELDFYPTPNEVTIALMQFLLNRESMSRSAHVWEPACGDGAMSKVIEKFVGRVFSSDIRDTGYGQPNYDFLKVQGRANFDAIITNPPFNLAASFIVKALEHAPVVAMLLKSQYWHAASRYELFVEHPPSFVLPLTWRPNFAPEKGNAPTMEVAWSVWIEGDTHTNYIPLLKPKYEIPF